LWFCLLQYFHSQTLYLCQIASQLILRISLEDLKEPGVSESLPIVRSWPYELFTSSVLHYLPVSLIYHLSLQSTVFAKRPEGKI
jgi:hypothetical protein